MRASASCSAPPHPTPCGPGPMFNGSTQVIFEGVPTYPDAGRCWNVVDKYKVGCRV